MSRAMSEKTKAELAQRRARHRKQRIAEERAKSDRRLRRARNRDRLRVELMRTGYFKRKYGDAWREVMAARAAGADPDDYPEQDQDREAQLLHRHELEAEREGRLF